MFLVLLEYLQPLNEIDRLRGTRGDGDLLPVPGVADRFPAADEPAKRVHNFDAEQVRRVNSPAVGGRSTSRVRRFLATPRSARGPQPVAQHVATPRAAVRDSIPVDEERRNLGQNKAVDTSYAMAAQAG